MIERGDIFNRGRAQQQNKFSGLRYGNITPTDIDGLIEYHNRAYIFIEVKYLDACLPFGQKLALERLVKDLGKAGKPAIAIVAEHNIHNVDEDVPAAECRVREFYLCSYREWRPPKRSVKVKELIDSFIDLHVNGKKEPQEEIKITAVSITVNSRGQLTLR